MAPAPAWVAPYVGLPYAERGRTREGVDCWGLCALVWTEHFGRPLPDYEGPHWRAARPEGGVAAAAEAYSAQFQRVSIEDVREGDGLLLRLYGLPLHCGLAVGEGWMLHSQLGCDSVVEPLGSVAWRNRILGAFRYV